MTTLLPPNPSEYRNLHQWARQFYDFFLSQTGVGSNNEPDPIVLPHKVANVIHRAVTPGVMLYDPTYGTPIFAFDNMWEPLRSALNFEGIYAAAYNVDGASITTGGFAVPFNTIVQDIAPWGSFDVANGHFTLNEGTYYVTGSVTVTKGSGGTKRLTGYIADVSDLTTPLGHVTLNTLVIDSSAPNDTTFVVPLSGLVTVPAGGKTLALVLQTADTNMYMGVAHDITGYDNVYARITAALTGI